MNAALPFALAERRIYLVFEFVLIFIAVPALLGLGILPDRPLVALGVCAALVTMVLWRDAAFDTECLLRRAPARWVAVRALGLGIVLCAAVAVLTPALLFAWTAHARTTLLFLALYPLISVYPQEVVYRAFLFQRYRLLFPTETRCVLASTFVFSFAHVVYGNWVAVTLTFGGGLLFGWTYSKSRSVLLASVEHSILGWAVFLSGLGIYFKM